MSSSDNERSLLPDNTSKEEAAEYLACVRRYVHLAPYGSVLRRNAEICEKILKSTEHEPTH